VDRWLKVRDSLWPTASSPLFSAAHGEV